MKTKKLLLLILVGLALLSAGILIVRFLFGGPEDAWICSKGQWVRHGQPAAAQPTTPCPAAAGQAAGKKPLPAEMDFYETGYQVRDNPGLEPGVRYLLYERLGSAALQVKLEFDADSKCHLNGAELPCSGLAPEKGVRTRIEGYRLDAESVLVRNLIAPSPF